MAITWWSRPIRRALVGTVGAMALVVAGVALYVYLERARTLDEGRAAAGRLAHALEEQAARAFHGVDLTLLGIADAMAVAPRLEAHNPAFEDALRRRLAHLPFVRGLFVVGADGFVIQETNQPRSPHLSLADRGYFRVQAENPETGLYISAPLMSRVVGRWFISASRRINGATGRFAGIAAAAVEPGYFERLYQTLHLGEGDAIALFKTDGTLLFRSPYPEGAIGKSFADLEVVRRVLPDRGAGTFRARSPFDGVRRIVSYRVVEGLPLVVAVGLAERPLLAGWRRLAITALTGTVVAIALATTVSLLLARQARQRRELQERLAHARGLEDLGRMTGGIAHDFNNVLNVVATNLETIRRRAATERLPVSVDPAMRAVEQGTKLVSQLLAFARRQELTVRPLDTNRVVQALIPVLTQATGPRVVIRTDLADGVWACLADEAQLNSALLNLVVNARDAMPEGQGVIRITTRNYPLSRQPSVPNLAPGDYVRVTVTDNGSGMPASVARRATEPLYTTKGEGMGAGLGLSQAYGFARQVGGDLVIESTVGVGTSVHLVLRRAPGTPGAGGPEDDRLRDARSRRSPGELRAESP
jgi:signal transduction histidine kinase